VTATTDTALLEQQNWFGGALGTVGRVSCGGGVVVLCLVLCWCCVGVVLVVIQKWYSID